MIRYRLQCPDGHGFDAWFPNSVAYDDQRAAGTVLCAICGDARVVKAMMAPAVRSARPTAPRVDRDPPAPVPAPVPGGSMPSPAQILAAIRAKVEQSADYVGREFAAEARRIHEGEADERPIWGEARESDVEALRDDGIEVFPLPALRRQEH